MNLVQPLVEGFQWFFLCFHIAGAVSSTCLQSSWSHFHYLVKDVVPRGWVMPAREEPIPFEESFKLHPSGDMEIQCELCRILLLLLLLPFCQSRTSPRIQSQGSKVLRSARGEWSKYPMASFRRLAIRPWCVLPSAWYPLQTLGFARLSYHG